MRLTRNIVIYGRQDCIFCDKAKVYLDDLNAEYQYIDITYWTKDERENLKAKYNVKTVPVILIDGTMIGGYNELVHQFHLV
jgi:glutaredoxin